MNKKYTFDEIIASAYYVFRDGLTSTIIANYLTSMKKINITFTREESKLKELKRLIVFNGYSYSLAEGVCMQDIISYVNNNLVLVFEEIKTARDNYYSNLTSKVKRK